MSGMDRLIDHGVIAWGMSRKALVPFRKDVQMVFQDPYSSLNPRQTIGSIIGAVIVLVIYSRVTGRKQNR